MEHRVLIVAGSDPNDRIGEFSCSLEVAPYIIYRREDAERLKELKLLELREMKKNPEAFGAGSEAYIDACIEEIEGESAEDYFFDDLTCWYEHDEDGNAICKLNPDGKYLTCFQGGGFAQPFMLKSGETAYQARKSEIDWGAVHMNKEMVNLYERTWEMCVEGLEPVSDIDRQVYENMKNRQDYFEHFKDKDEYVASCTSFWAYAFLSPIDIWTDADDCPVSQFEWMSTFYERFIKPLPDDTLLTIFEYTMN